jgi:ferredoxin
VKVIVRSGYEEMKASPWEREDAMHEGISIHNYMVPLEFTHDNGRLTGVLFEKVRAEYDERGRRSLIPTGEPHEHVACDEVLVAIGQENSFPWIERDIGLEFDRWEMPVLDTTTLQSSLPRVFFGGDAALGPKNIITAVAQGHEAAISIDFFCQGKDLHRRPPPRMSFASQKMGIHEWIYDNQVSVELRRKVPTQDMAAVLKNLELELELGFDEKLAMTEAARCLNCDMATVFTPPQCIECDACVDICPSECITFTAGGAEADLRGRLKAPAPNTDQPLYVAEGLKTGRAMVKDENLCLHCGLCAERCPTGAWDMQKVVFHVAHAGAEVQAL